MIERRARAATEDIHAELGGSEAAAVDAYLRLVEIDEDGQPVRAEVAVASLAPDVQAMLAVFERHRLVVRDRRGAAGGEGGVTPSPAAGEVGAGALTAPVDQGEPTRGTGEPAAVPAGAHGAATVEVIVPVHEEVFRAWPALAAAIGARRTDLQTRTWLRRDAHAWAASGRGQVPLTGGRLSLAADWAERNPPDVTGEVGAYLRAALSQRRRRRALTVAAPVLAAVVVVVAVLAIQAIRARADADALRLAADARASFDARLDLGLLLALEAGARSDGLAVQATALDGLAHGPGPRRIEDVGAETKLGALGSSGERAVLVAPDRAILWDAGAAAAAGSVAGPIEAVAISADGSTVAIARPDSLELRAWPGDAITAACPAAVGPVEILRLSEHGDVAVVVAVDRTGAQAASRVVVVRAADCAATPLAGVDGLVVAADLDAAADRIALGTSDAGVGVWQASTGRKYDVDFPLEPPVPGIKALAFGGDDLVAAITDLGRLRAWNARTGAPALDMLVLGAPATALRYWPAQDAWLAAADDGELRVVHPASANPVGPPIRSLPGLAYRGSVGIVDLAATDAGAVTVDQSGRVVAFDLEGRPALGDQLLADRTVRHVRALADGTIVVAIPDGSALPDDATASGTGSVQLVDPRSGRASASIPVADPTVVAVDGAGYLVGTVSGEVLAGSAGGAPLRSIDRGAGKVTGLAGLPGGAVAVARTTGDAGTISVIAADGARHVRELGVEPRSLATNGRWLFLGTRDGSLHVLDPADPARDVAEARGHTTDVSSIAVAPDGTMIATGSDDRSVVIWDVAGSGQPTQRGRLTGHTDRVTSLAFSPDGGLLASSGEDHAVVLWDVASAAQVGDPIAVDGIPELDFAAGRDRELLVAGDGLGRWELRPEAWTALACRIIGTRTLGPEERQRYLHGDAPQAHCPAP